MSGRKVAKRACDACKIRKIKCTENSPCEGCIAAGVACTFIKNPHTRGPRRLRKTTLDEIKQTQREYETLNSSLAAVPATAPPNNVDLTPENVFAPSKVAALVLQLCVYRLRMYPVWPIIKMERLVASIQKPEPDIEVFALAYAVAAATIAQIKTKDSAQPGAVTAQMMEAQCQYAKSKRNPSDPPNVTTVRIAFFLHVYYENQSPGCLKSILYLREAIAVAHVVGLHRESYYASVPVEEQQIRRRTLWLLFVTERGVAILHKLPTILKTNIEFPTTNDTDEADVLFSFQKLVNLFWTFDQSGVFEVLDFADYDAPTAAQRQSPNGDAISTIQKQLNESLVLTEKTNDVQAVDIAVTHAWMRVIIWRLSQSHGIFARPSSGHPASNGPIQIAGDFLNAISQVPDTAIEAHGPGLELKAFEIASSVIDHIVLEQTEGFAHEPNDPAPSRGVIARLQRLLARNRKLEGMLRAKISRIQQNPQLVVGTNMPISGVAQSLSNAMDWDLEQELQAHAFDFSEPLQPGISPGTSSYASGNSPMPNTSHLSPRHVSPSSINQPRDWPHAALNSPSRSKDANFSHDTQQQQQQSDSTINFENMYDMYNQHQTFHYDMNAFNADPAMTGLIISDTGWIDNNAGHAVSEADEMHSGNSVASWHQ